jgi:hypothetical protein
MGEPSFQLVKDIEHIWRHGPDAARDNLIYGIARYVSKLGQLSVSDTELRAMQRFFKSADAVELYERVRDESGRCEEEWREDFVRYFPVARGVLPPVELTEEEIDEWLEEDDGA